MIFKSVAFVLLTIVCWGVYGPVLHKGQAAMAHSRWRPFICVGIAYFAIAVVVPVLVMQTGAESNAGFTATGTIWSLAGGAAGAIGALGIILAFNYGGRPSWVMPLVFGCAPVVNAFLTIYWAGSWKEINPFFLAGLVLVAMGAAMVLVFALGPTRHQSPPLPPPRQAVPAPHRQLRTTRRPLRRAAPTRLASPPTRRPAPTDHVRRVSPYHSMCMRGQ
ncbi:MAG: hypothetical protein R3C10_00055 [Pirellulales bacterium]